MTEFATNNPWVLALIALLLGLFLGVIGTQLFERRKTGGRTVDDVQSELDDYKEEVGKHFATTSELFRDMTEKYRDVYNHLATGSQALCEDSMEHARLEFTQNRSVEARDDVAETRSESDEVDETKVPEPDTPEPDTIADTKEAVSMKSAETEEVKRDTPPLGI